MPNEILHRVTNRASFATPLFPPSLTFTPRELPPAAETVRRLLQLDYTGDDYYVLGAMNALYSFPEMIEALGPDQPTFALAAFQRPCDTWVGVAPRNNQQGPFVLRRYPLEYPVERTITLQYVNPVTMLMLIGTMQLTVPVRVWDDIMDADWPPASGFSGGLSLINQSWDENFKAVITHMPVSFPYRRLMEILKVNRDVTLLLTQQGLIEHFTLAASPIERVATVLLALGLS